MSPKHKYIEPSGEHEESCRCGDCWARWGRFFRPRRERRPIPPFEHTGPDPAARLDSEQFSALLAAATRDAVRDAGQYSARLAAVEHERDVDPDMAAAYLADQRAGRFAVYVDVDEYIRQRYIAMLSHNFVRKYD